jgi:AcrR family transcriptional regulator
VAERRPYRQVARAEARQRTRDALLDAASRELYEGDWPKVSLAVVAERAGVSKQTLLRHFGSKEGLLVQTLIRAAAEIGDQRWSAPAGDVPGTIENLLDHYDAWGERALRVGSWQNDQGMLAVLSLGARQLHYQWVEHAFAPWLAELSGEPRRRTRGALIALCDVQTWWILSHDLGLDRGEVHAVLTDLVERLLSEPSS